MRKVCKISSSARERSVGTKATLLTTLTGPTDARRLQEDAMSVRGML